MKTLKTQRLNLFWAFLMLSAALCSAPALAADKSGAAASQSRYQREMAACNTAPEGTDKAACRREAGAARASNDLEDKDADAARFSSNALKRCESLSEPFRGDCVARIQGDGTTSGSVAGGGVYRELVTPGIVSPTGPPAVETSAPPAK